MQKHLFPFLIITLTVVLAGPAVTGWVADLTMGQVDIINATLTEVAK